MPQYAKLNTELARSIGILDATRVGGSPRAPRTFSRATDCKVTRADGTTYVIAATTTGSRKGAVPHRKLTIIKADNRPELFRSY